MKQQWDRLLRPIGAATIILLAFSLMALSFYMRERPVPGMSRWQAAISRGLHSAASLESWFYDLRSARFYDHGGSSPNLVILELDNQSLQRVGRFPWTRSRYAQILDNLKAYGANTVMFDVTFPESESEAADSAFAAGINRFAGDEKGAVILGYGLTPDPEQALSPLPDSFQMTSSLSGSAGSDPMLAPQYVDRENFAAPLLQTWDTKFASMTAESDVDGIFRHAGVLTKINSELYPSLGAAGFVNFFKLTNPGGQVSAEPLPAGQGYVLSWKNASGEKRALISPRGEIQLRYFGGQDNFIRMPAFEVVEDKNPAANKKMKSIFAGKAVLFGSSALGAHDLRHTPVDPQMPGMYMHANLFHAFDQNYFFRSEDASFLFSLLLLAMGVGGVLFLSRKRNPPLETGGVVAIAALIFALDYFYFSPAGYFIRLFFALNGTVVLFLFFTVLNVFDEAREKKKIRETFTRYVAPSIVKEMLANPEKLKVGGEKKEITMLFSDVRDFTTISERLNPADLSALLNIYMGQMTDILFDTGGTLDKYIGDALVGFWGAPLDLPNHAYHAVRGAKQMLEALPAINDGFLKKKYPAINIGIGLNTGEVVVGNMGSDRIFQYTALGDHMNLASRLESLTKYYGVNLMISEFTLEAMGEKASEFRIRPLDLVKVKGKTKAVKIFEVIPDWSPWAKRPELLKRYTAAYEEEYLRGNFSAAKASFEAVLGALGDDKNTLKLLESTEGYLLAPPAEGWDGVTVHTSK
jgi:adenylate cyclase